MSSDDRISQYASGIFEIAKGEGELDRVRAELLEIGRAFQSSNELRDALGNPQLPAERKEAIVNDLLGSRATDLTRNVVSLIVGMGRANSIPAIADALAETAAASSNREVAEIRTAIELDDETVGRLISALERKTGKSLEAKVVVDPTVLGGIIAQVGDTVIDGSVKRRLSSLRQALKA
jgi:F-type H+-transporting ATPase subunit delta